MSGTITRGDDSVERAVTLVDEDDLVVGVVTPDGAGGFTLVGVAPGSYELTTETVGFEETTVAADVAAGETAEIEFEGPPSRSRGFPFPKRFRSVRRSLGFNDVNADHVTCDLQYRYGGW